MLPAVAEGAEPVWHLFVVRSREREKFQSYLKSAGVNTLVHYPVPPHLQEAYAEMGLAEGTYPITETIHREVLSLPMGPHLSSEDAAQVVEAVRSFKAF